MSLGSNWTGEKSKDMGLSFRSNDNCEIESVKSIRSMYQVP